MSFIRGLQLFKSVFITKPSPRIIQAPINHAPLQQSPRFFALDAKVIRECLPEAGADKLIKAIREADYEKAEWMIMHGINVDGHNSRENSALIDAAKRGDAKGVEFLLTKLNANPLAFCDRHHQTALHYAAAQGHKETVAVLLKHGAQPYILDSRNKTAIDLAKSTKVKQMLVNPGSDGKKIAQQKMNVKCYLPK